MQQLLLLLLLPINSASAHTERESRVNLVAGNRLQSAAKIKRPTVHSLLLLSNSERISTHKLKHRPLRTLYGKRKSSLKLLLSVLAAKSVTLTLKELN